MVMALFQLKRPIQLVVILSHIAVAVGDFNNDRRLDIVVANYWTNNIGVFLGDGNGTFSSQKTYSTGYNSGPISVIYW